MRCLIVIPARMGSTRFPGKPLVDLCGKPMLQWVYEACVAAGVGDGIVVATPDWEIQDACKSFGAEAVLTSQEHPTGTDRIAEVAKGLEAEVYINVQGDEPLIRSATVTVCAAPMLKDPAIEMASVFSPCPIEEVDNPSTVKVVTDYAGTPYISAGMGFHSSAIQARSRRRSTWGFTGTDGGHCSALPDGLLRLWSKRRVWSSLGLWRMELGFSCLRGQGRSWQWIRRSRRKR